MYNISLIRIVTMNLFLYKDYILIKNYKKKKRILASHWWLILVILGTWETEIERIMAQAWPKQTAQDTPFLKPNRTKWI
jgi:hypothetical protein